MQQVNINIEGSKGTLECSGHNLTVYGTGKSRNETTLNTLIAALERMTKPAVLRINIDNPYVRGSFNYTSLWRRNDWKTAKGKDIAHRTQWIYVTELLGKHKYYIQNGKEASEANGE